MLFENLTHNLLYLFIRDLLGLLVEEISLLLVDDVEVSREILADFSRVLRELGDQRWYQQRGCMWDGSERCDGNERLTFSGSVCFSIERDSLLEVFSLSDILER